MATVCQETASTPPNMFGPRTHQMTPHSYYNHCGYPAATGHGQYPVDGYMPFQTSTPADQSTHHIQHHQQQHHLQQSWGYGMGVGVVGAAARPGLEDWTQGHLFGGGNNNASSQAPPYGYPYRSSNTHVPLDYGGGLTGNHEPDPQSLETSPSPNSSCSGEGLTPGPNNQGSKSLRPPYEWMKPSASLPQAGKTRTKDKYRVVYSDHQRLELEKEFHFSKYITIRRKAEIAAQLGLSERQVKIWFQNRRAKERKQNKKREEQVTLHGTSGVGSDHQQHQQHQQLQQPGSLDSHPFMTKLELDDDKSHLQQLSCHVTPGLVLHPGLHTSTSMAPVIMSRVGQPSLGRYHDSMPGLSPSESGPEVSYRMTSTGESSTHLNMSGSSDSGVVSSH